jgi:hypothetical protein
MCYNFVGLEHVYVEVKSRRVPPIVEGTNTANKCSQSSCLINSMQTLRTSSLLLFKHFSSIWRTLVENNYQRDSCCIS